MSSKKIPSHKLDKWENSGLLPVDNKHTYYLNWIENATYKEVLTKIRFGEMDDPILNNADLFKKLSSRLNELKAIIGSVEAVRISKEVGWEEPHG